MAVHHLRIIFTSLHMPRRPLYDCVCVGLVQWFSIGTGFRASDTVRNNIKKCMADRERKREKWNKSKPKQVKRSRLKLWLVILFPFPFGIAKIYSILLYSPSFLCVFARKQRNGDKRKKNCEHIFSYLLNKENKKWKKRIKSNKRHTHKKYIARERWRWKYAMKTGHTETVKWTHQREKKRRNFQIYKNKGDLKPIHRYGIHSFRFVTAHYLSFSVFHLVWCCCCCCCFFSGGTIQTIMPETMADSVALWLWSMFIVGHLSKFCHFISHVNVNVSILKMATNGLKRTALIPHFHNHFRSVFTENERICTLAFIHQILEIRFTKVMQNRPKRKWGKLLKINSIWTTAQYPEYSKCWRNENESVQRPMGGRECMGM